MDFNFPELKWGENYNISDLHIFTKSINDIFFNQVVHEPTRGENYLDLVFCLDENMIESMYVEEPIETSDHQQIRLTLVCSRDKINKIVQ